MGHELAARLYGYALEHRFSDDDPNDTAPHEQRGPSEHAHKRHDQDIQDRSGDRTC